MNHRIAAVVVAGCLLSGLSVTASAVDVDEAIGYRQGVFKAIKWNVGPMGAMLKGARPFDAKAFLMYATRVEALSQMPLEGFVEGSDVGETSAKPEIWSQWPKFESRMQDFQTQAAKLVEVAKGGDQGAIKAQFGATTKSCKACHDDFRVKD